MDLFKLLGTIAVENSGANKSIDDTTSKGKEAGSTLTSAFAKVGKAIVNGFKKAPIDETNSSLKGITGTVDTQEKKLKDLKTRYADLYLTHGKNSKEAREVAAEIKSLSAELNKNKSKISDAEAAADKYDKTLEEVGDTAEKSEGKLSKVFSVVGKGAAAFVAGAAAVAGGIVALSNSTAEYTEDMGKLTVAFEQHNFSAEAAQGVYKEFVGILGETDQAVEAANHLAQLCDTEEELGQYTRIISGIYATFGDSLPVEGLTEAANETARVGQVTGPFADAINWAKVSTEQFSAGLAGNKDALAAFNAAISDGKTREDAYTAALQACGSEQERSQLITSTLTALYGEAGNKYQEVNKDLIESRKAQADWNAAVGEAGEAVRPMANAITGMGTALVQKALPYLEKFAIWATGKLPAVQAVFDATLGRAIGLIEDVGAAFQSGDSLGEKFGNAIVSIGDKVTAAIPILSGKAVEMMQKFGQSLAQNIPVIASQALPMLTQLSGAIRDNLPTLAAAAGDMILGLVKGIVASLPVLIQEGPKIVSNIANGISGAMQTIFAKGVEILWEVLKGIASAIPEVIANLPAILQAIWDAFIAFQWLNLGKQLITLIGNGIKSVGTQLPNIVKGIFNDIKSSASNIWNSIKSGISGNVSGIKNLVSSGFNAVKSVASSVWNGVLSAIKNPIETAKNVVKAAIDKIKGFFNFKFSWPKLSLPHFSISPAGWAIGDLLKGKLPKLGIEWYAKAMDNPIVMTKPTIWGYDQETGTLKGGGEAGPEVVSGAATLMNMIQSAVAAQNDNLVALLQMLIDMLAAYFQEALAAMRTPATFDPDRAAAALAGPMDRELGKLTKKKDRGR